MFLSTEGLYYQPYNTDISTIREQRTPINIRHGHHGNLRPSLVEKAHKDFCVYIIQGTNILMIMLHAKDWH